MGVLCLQGSFAEHLDSLKKLGITPREVKTPEDFENLAGLIVPGGESTALTKVMHKNKLDAALKKAADEGTIFFGTCAGAIILSNYAKDKRVKNFGIIDAEVERNAYGRQNESFVKEISIFGIGSFRAIFIRAPIIKSVGKNVRILASEGKEIFMAENNRAIIATFHPELTGDLRVHKYFLDKVKNSRK